MAKHEYIMYLSMNFPGETGFSLRRVTSLTQALCEFENFKLNSGVNASATLYPYSEEAWKEAEKFATVGCPFDHPSKVIENGPQGGTRIVDA
jgi:hypothetical protein